MSNYAIVETGSKQYWVEPEAVIEVEKLPQDIQKEAPVSLDKVLLAKNGKEVHVGRPVVEGAKVVCEYLGDSRSKKVYSFKFRRRKNSRRLQGHRQDYARLRVKEIQL